MLSHQKKLSSLPIVDDWLLEGVDILTFTIDDANAGSKPTGLDSSSSMEVRRPSSFSCAS